MNPTPPNGPHFAAACKNIMLIAMLVAVGFSQSTPHVSAQATPTGPVGEWRFDEGSGSTASDSSGNYRDGSIAGATWISGHSGNALEFDGFDDYVQIDDPGLPAGDFTYMAWVKPTSGEDLHVFMASDGFGDNEIIFKLLPDHTIGLWLDHTKHDDSVGLIAAKSGQWNHIAVTRSEAVVTTYMNGNVDGILTDASTLSFGSCPLFIGLDVDSGCTGGLGNWADGGIDEARVYDRPLSASQIQEIASSASLGLVGEWRLDEGSGTTAVDTSGYGKDGDIVGATWVPGHSGSSLDFDGTGDYVQIDGPRPPAEDFTYMAWVKPTSGKDLHVFMASDGLGGNELIFKLRADHKIGLWMDGTKHDDAAGSIAAAVGQWNHIAVTRSGATVTTYMNGEVDGTLTDGSILSFGSCPLFLGLDVDSGCTGGLGNWADGGIDDARMYDRALSPSEILAVARDQETPPAPNSDSSELQRQVCQELPPASSEDLGCPAATGRLPPNWLESFESVQTATQTSAGHDWDGDGIPDVLDAVNLPSEAQETLATGDTLDLPQGLEVNGFMLLVEPGHEEAYMVVAAATASSVQTTSAAAALAWVESAYGVAGRNALARVLHEDITVHMQEIQANTPLTSQSLPFASGQAADGSWLLLRSDATRSVELILGGVDAPVAPPLASHLTQAATNPRWEFLNLHWDDSFCYDDAVETGASACTGGTDPGWIRAYSGQGAYALESLEAALAMDLVDIGLPSIEDVISDLEELQGAVEELRDYDGDGTANHNEAANGANPVYAQSTPATDDDGDGWPNGQEIHHLVLGNLGSALCSGAYGIVLAPSCSGYERPYNPFAGEGVVQEGAGGPYVDEDGALWVWDAVCAPASQGDYAPCKGEASNYDADDSIYTGDWISDGYGWRHAADVPPGLPAVDVDYVGTCDTATEDQDDDGIPVVRLCQRRVVVQPDGSFSDEELSTETEVGDPDDGSSLQQASQDGAAGTGLGGSGTAGVGNGTPPEQMDSQTNATVPPAPGPTVEPSAILGPSGFRVPESAALHSAFEEDSPWQVMGEESREFGHGVGVDYLFDLDGLDAGQSLVTQAMSLENASTPPVLRQFHFEGNLIKLPAQPHDLRSVSIGIEAIDGDHSGQAFVLDGRALDAMLDLDGGAPAVEVDEDHEEGFAYDVRDVDGDGYDDVVAYVPHFSQSWIRVSSSQACTDARFWDVEVVSSTSAWMSSDCGKVYEYKVDVNGNGYLQGHTIEAGGQSVSPDQEAFGLHLLGSREFFVVGEGDCSGGTGNPSFIAHFQDTSFQSVTWKGSKCSTLYDVWMNPSGTRGFAGGTGIILQEYTQGAWLSTQASNRPHVDCAILEIDLDDQARGYFGLVPSACGSEDPDASPVMFFDGSSFSAQSVDGGGIYDVMDASGQWAAGLASSSKPGIYKQSGSSWSQVSGVPDYPFHGASRMPGSDVTWFAGSSTTEDAYIVKHTGSSWKTDGSDFTVTTSLPATSKLWDVELLDKRFGLAVGEGTILQFKGNQPPVADGRLLDSAGNALKSSVLTQEVVKVDTQGSDDPDDDGVWYLWEWGDGSSTRYPASGYTYPTSSTYSTVSMSHEYSHPDTYTVKLTVTDEYGDWDSKTFSVDVNAEVIDLGTSDSTSFSGAEKQRHHYRVPSSNGKVVEAKLTSSCTSGVTLLGRVGSPVPRSASSTYWPSSTSTTGISSPTLLADHVSGGDLYLAVEKPAGVSTASCTLSVKAIAEPSTPTIVSLPSLTGTPVELEATAGHPDGYDTRIKVRWESGGSWFSTALEPPGTLHTTSYSSYEPGDYTVSVRSVDQFGQLGSIVSQSVTVRDPPTVVADGATSIQDAQATLTGRVTDKGGTSSVTARYVLYEGWIDAGQLVTSKTYSGFTGSTLPTWTVTGLQAGTVYWYGVEAENDLLTGTDHASFQTDSTTSTLPDLVGEPESATAGTVTGFGLRPDRSESQDVAYHVSWGDGSTNRYPSSGYMSSSDMVSIAHTYALPYGDVVVAVQLETQSGGRSDTVTHGVSVGGSSPLDWVTHTPQATNVALQGKLASVVEDGSTKARFKYLDGGTWRTSPWYTGLSDASSFGSWTTPSMSYFRTYNVFVEIKASAGASWLSSPLSVQTNRVPELTVLDTASREATYLDDVRFSVLYQDGDGDAPTSIQVDVNGQLLDMHPPAGSGLDYRGGVEYHYVLSGDELGAPGTHTPTYRASDGKAHRAATSVQGGAITVTQAAVATHTFEDDSIGGVPAGFTKSLEPLNYWRVADTGAAGMSHYVALGGHGNALWFARSPQGTYNDPGGGTPKGSVSTMEYDLSSVEDPVLSFSSYYETEDLGDDRDRKLVYVNAKDPGDSFWEIRDEPLYEVTGLEGGYKKWRSQAIDLSDYDGKVVQFVFRFDAVDNHDNSHVGWLIDDVSIGHDADGDTLPDELEASTELVHVMRPAFSVDIPDGQTGRAFVDGFTQPHADSVFFESLVFHDDPDDLRVYIGVEASDYASPATKVLLWDQGTIKNPCGFYNFWTRSMVWVQSRPVVIPTQDGLDIKADMGECLAFWTGMDSGDLLEKRTWFVEIEDTDATDGQAPSIGFIRMAWKGTTNAGRADTDRDGVQDNVERMDWRKNPLTTDGDFDGVPEWLDSDDTIPQWIPATLLELHGDENQQSYLLSMSFYDVPYLLVDATFRDSNGGPMRTDTWNFHEHTWSTRLAGTPGLESSWPETVSFEVMDAAGASLFFDIGLSYESTILALDSLEVHYEANNNVETISWGVEGLQGNERGRLLMIGGEAWKVAKFGRDVLKIARGNSAFGILTRFNGLDPQLKIDDPPQREWFAVTRSGDQVVVPSGSYSNRPPFFIPREVALRAQAQGLSSSGLSDSLQDADVSMNDVMGIDRFVHTRNDGHVVMQSFGHRVVDAWLWQTPQGGRSPIEPSLQEVVDHQDMLAGIVMDGSAGEEQLAATNCLAACTYNLEGRIELVINDGDHGKFERRGIIFVPLDALYSIELMQRRASLGNQGFEDRVIAAWLGASSLDRARQAMADQAALDSNGASGHWYWDQGNTDFQCGDLSTPSVRRCSRYTVSTVLSDETMTSWNQDFQMLDGTWHMGGTAVASDALGNKGRINEDHMPITAMPGVDPAQEIIKEMDASMTTSVSNEDALVLTGADLSHHANPYATLLYEET